MTDPKHSIRFDRHDRSKCIYCGLAASTKDHLPPRGTVPEVWRSNFDFLTVPSCKECNTEKFSESENVLSAVLAAVGVHQEQTDELRPGNRVGRAMSRDRKLYSLITERLKKDGRFECDDILLESIRPALAKIGVGIHFQEYGWSPGIQNTAVVMVEHEKNTAFQELILRTSSEQDPFSRFPEVGSASLESMVVVDDALFGTPDLVKPIPYWFFSSDYADESCVYSLLDTLNVLVTFE